MTETRTVAGDAAVARSLADRHGAGARRLAAVDVAVLLAYAAAAFVYLWPLPRYAWNHSLYDPGGFAALGMADYYLIVWVMSWVAHAVWHAPLHPFDANTFFPAPLALAYSEHLAGYLPLFGPVYWLTGNGVFALNVTAYLTYPLSAFFTYLLARRFLGRPGALVAGAFYAFCASRYEVGSHFHMLGVQYLPVIVWALDAWLERARTSAAVLLAIALLLQSLSSVYLAYATMLLGMAVGPVLLLEHRACLDRRRVLGLAAVLAVVGAVLVASMVPYLTLQSYGLVPGYDDELVPYGLVPQFARMHVREYLSQGVGRLGYALALVGALPGGACSFRRLRRVGIALTVVGIVAALGPRIAVGDGSLWSPYQLLMAVVPGFATVRLPKRFTILAQLGLALLAGVGFARLVRDRRPALAYALAAACAAFVVAGRLWLTHPPVHREVVPGDVPPAYTWLAANGDGRAVLELPRAKTAAAEARRAQASTYHWQPIFDGYGAYPPQHGVYLFGIAAGLPDATALQDLVDRVDVGWVLVHRDEQSPQEAAPWRQPLPDGLALVAEWPDVAIYRVTRPVVNDLRDRLLSRTQTLEGTPIAPLGARCDGALTFIGWSAPLVARSDVRARFRIENRSGAVWPAAGFYPRTLVDARADVRKPGGQAVSKWRVPLLQDVHPGEPLAFDVPFRTPTQPGHYELHVDLVQDGVKSLRDCGLPGLNLPLDIVPPAAPPPAG
jgi:hypothetical protein